MLVSDRRSGTSKLSQTAQRARDALMKPVRVRRESLLPRGRANTELPSSHHRSDDASRAAGRHTTAGPAPGGARDVHRDLMAHAQLPHPDIPPLDIGAMGIPRTAQRDEKAGKSIARAGRHGTDRATSGGLFSDASSGGRRDSIGGDANSVTSDALAAWIDAENNEGSMRSGGSFSDQSDVHDDGSLGSRSTSGNLTPASPSPRGQFRTLPAPESGAGREGGGGGLGSPRPPVPAPKLPTLRRTRLNRPRGNSTEPSRAGVGLGPGSPAPRPTSTPRTPRTPKDSVGVAEAVGVAQKRQRRRSVTTMGYSTRQLGLNELRRRRRQRFDSEKAHGAASAL